MTFRELTRRNLKHYWRTNLAVVAGIAIATATYSGSGLVGESVRRSLLDIATSRVGNVGGAILAAQPFTESLAKRVGVNTAPVLHFEAVLKHQTTGRSALKVLVYGVDDRFWTLHQLPNPLQGGEREIVLSEPLAEELNAQNGEGLLLRIEKPSEIPQETLHARREQSVRSVRFRMATRLPDSGIGGFSLKPQQGAARTAFVRLSTLQKELDLAGRANLILLPEEIRSDLPILGHLLLEDVGLRIEKPPTCGCIQLESPAGLLREDQVERALATAKQQGLRAEVFLLYMANAMRTRTASVPYSLVIARAGIPDGTIVLNDWTARELQAKLGDVVTMDYFLWKQEGRLLTESSIFVVNGVQPLAVLGDRYQSPKYPGISDTESLSDWDPPFPMDLNKIRPQDEAYWHDYRTTPKAAVNLAEGQKLWGTRFGKVTAIRIYGAPGAPLPALNITPSTDLARDGIQLLAPRRQAEESAAGTTDFGEYFGYFSFFLVVSAILLTSLFFRLGIEQRLREIGLYQSIGFNGRTIRRIFLREGFALGAVGSLLGLALGVGYSMLILQGLRTWWVDAVGTTALQFHFSVKPLSGALLQGLLSALIVIAFSLRRLRHLSPRQLLSGIQPDERVPGARWLRWAAFAFVGLGLLLLVLGALGVIVPEGGFFGSGFCLLVGGTLFVRLWLESPRLAPVASLGELSLASAAQRPTRAMMTVLLIGLAVFLLVSLEAFRHGSSGADADVHSGSGGYPLMAESQWPIYQNLGTPDGRAALNVNEQSIAGMTLTSFRVRPGEDTSCLNLYQPVRPKIVGAPEAFRKLNRFRVEPANAWQVLDQPLPKGVIPAMVDANTLEYVLHKKVGETMDIPHGVEPIRIQFVGTLAGSVFQSEIVLSEANFLKLFPEEQGFRLFLIEAPTEKWNAVTTTLEESLSDSGFDVMPTASRLAQFHRVENTYLSTFQALGAMGLLLGTIGLAAVLLRNVLERRRELALLRAVGFTTGNIVQLIVSENAFLLAAGLGLGTLCALVAVSPALAHRGQSVSLLPFLWLLLSVFVTGLATAYVATRLAIGSPLLSSLRSE